MRLQWILSSALPLLLLSGSAGQAHAAALSTTTAATSSANVTNLLSELSTCALECLFITVPQVNCDLIDIACQCSRTNLTALAASCMLANCTLEESLKLVQVDAQQCNRPHDNLHAAVQGMAIMSGAMTFLMIFMRVVTRLWTVGSLWWDDYFHLLAGCFAIPLTIFANLLSEHGFGYHLYDVKINKISEATDLLYWYYLCQVLWATAIFWVKISILCLYLRIFPGKNFRIAVFGVMGLLITSFLILLPMAIFQCVPVHAAWTLNYKEARCLNISDVAYANAALNIATEVAILILPLPMLHTLKVAGRKRIALYALFGAGVLVIAIAAARIPTLSHIATLNDPTYANVPAFVWTCAETTIVHICAAAPAIRSLLSKTKNKFSTKTSSYDRQRYGSNSGTRSARFGSTAGSAYIGGSNSNSNGSRRLHSLSITSETGEVEKGWPETATSIMELTSHPSQGQTTTTIVGGPQVRPSHQQFVNATSRFDSRDALRDFFNRDGAASPNRHHLNRPQFSNSSRILSPTPPPLKELSDEDSDESPRAQSPVEPSPETAVPINGRSFLRDSDSSS